MHSHFHRRCTPIFMKVPSSTGSNNGGGGAFRLHEVRTFHGATLAKSFPQQSRYRSITRSLRGFEQQSSLIPASISFWRIPPLCSIATEPEISFDLHVPHTPMVHADGSRRPANRAASKIVISSGHSITRRDFENSTFRTMPCCASVKAAVDFSATSTASCSAGDRLSKSKLSSW